MEGYKETTAQGGYQKVIWDSILDTYEGGVTLTNTGDGTDYIPAGTPVSVPDATTGLSTIVTASGSDSGGGATMSGTVMGYTQSDVLKDKNPMVGVVLAGTMRKASAVSNVNSYPLSFMKATPRVQILG